MLLHYNKVWTERWTDGQTVGQTDRVIIIGLLYLRSLGPNYYRLIITKLVELFRGRKKSITLFCSSHVAGLYILNISAPLVSVDLKLNQL